jgi:D-proline reductase (dithiol) PrdB
MENFLIRTKQLKDRLIGRMFSRYPNLVRFWARRAEIKTNADIPWAPFKKKIAQCRLALVSTAGVHLRSQSAFDMHDPDGDPTFREIPSATPRSELQITHNYYDHRDADADVNILFPLETVRFLENSREIDQVNHRHFSFMGHIRNRHLDTLVHETAPQVASSLVEDEVDIALLTPA